MFVRTSRFRHKLLSPKTYNLHLTLVMHIKKFDFQPVPPFFKVSEKKDVNTRTIYLLCGHPKCMQAIFKCVHVSLFAEPFIIEKRLPGGNRERSLEL